MIFLNTALAASPRYRQTEEPPASTYDVDFQAKIDFADTNGVPKPSATQLDAENQRVVDYKATGVWDIEDCYFDYTGVDDTFIQWRLIDTKRRVQAIQYGSLTWTSNGVKGNGANGYIDPLYNPSTFGGNWTLNSASIGYKLFDIGSAGVGAIVAYYSNSSDLTYVIPNNGSSSYMAINQNVGGLTLPAYASLEYTQIDRVSSGQINLNGSQLSRAWTSNALSKGLYILARNNNGTADLFSDAGLSFITLGGNKNSYYSAIKNIT